VRVIILGGGGFRVPLIVRELTASGLPVRELVLYDTDAGRLTVIAAVLAGAGLAGTGVAGTGPDSAGGRAAPPVTATRDLDIALRGADLIFSALRVGGLDGRVRDEREALALGVLGQETVGAGGLASAARTVPVVDAIARRIRELAPDAWVISMTNPAGIVTEVMSAVLGPRVIGVCDSPVGLIRRACAACGVDPGASLGAVTDRVEADYIGLNHLGWLRGLRVGGVNLFPDLPNAPSLLSQIEEGRLFGPDVIGALGTLPNEYLYWYYSNAEAVRDVIAAGRTRGEHVRTRQREFYAAAGALLENAGADPETAQAAEAAARLWREANEERNRSYFAELRTGEKTGERDEADVAAGGYESVAIALASALSGGPAARLILNVRNDAGSGSGAGAGSGAGDTVVPGLSPETVVEVPCRVDASGAIPLPVSPPSAHELGLMSVVRGCERDIAAAALLAAGNGALAPEGADAGALALRAFATHPLVGSLDAARVLAQAAVPMAFPPGPIS
jgi:6-phospho-beta-glucosidase